MYKLNEIKELLKLMDQTSLQELEIENEGSRILIRKANKTETVVVSASPVQQPVNPVIPAPALPAEQNQASVQPADQQDSGEQSGTELHKIVSPMVGTFYCSQAPGADAFVSPGTKVGDKTVVCIIEAMKLMNEIEAEVKGEIVDVLVENGQLVEYGQPLFLVKPE